MMFEPVWIVGFTGHRPGEAAGRSKSELMNCRQPIAKVLRDLQLQAQQNGGRIELLTSLAAGADLEAAVAAEQIGLTVNVILPMPKELFAQDFEGDYESWSVAEKFIDMAMDPQRNGTLRVAHGYNLRPHCYHETNVQMLQACDALVAVWNGEPAEGLAGTEEVIAHAKRLELPVVQIDPSREGKTWKSGELQSWPPEDSVFCEIREICSADPKRQALGSNSTGLECFETLNDFATEKGRKFRGRLIIAMLLHFFAALLAATTASFTEAIKKNAEINSLLYHCPTILTAFELALVLVATGVMLWMFFAKLHEQWRKSRFAAEKSCEDSMPLRVFLTRWIL